MHHKGDPCLVDFTSLSALCLPDTERNRMEEFNSSDIEYEREEPETEVGASSIRFIIDNAFEDRLLSKKAIKGLQYESSSKKTDLNRDLWFRRFRTFREYSLNAE